MSIFRYAHLLNFTAGIFLLSGESAFAEQQTSKTGLTGNDNQEARAGIYDSAFNGSRAFASGYSIEPFALGLDAAVNNPAGIGGLHEQKGDKFLKHFHFPYISGIANDNSAMLAQDLTLGGGASDLTITTAVADAGSGVNQFARSSFLPDIMFGRFLIAPFIDSQLSAVQASPNSSEVELLYQGRSGIGLGFSFTDPQQTVYLGVFSSISSLNRTSGFFLVDDMEDETTSAEQIDANSATYQGTDTAVGMSWRISKKADPVLSVTAQHIGGTTYTGSDDKELKDDQILTIGFGMSPSLGKYFHFNYSLSGTNIDRGEIPVSEKWRLAGELNLGPDRTKPWIGFRCGASSKGFSYGGVLKLGFIGAEYANYPEDIGTSDHLKIERRNSASVYVDLAD